MTVVEKTAVEVLSQVWHAQVHVAMMILTPGVVHPVMHQFGNAKGLSSMMAPIVVPQIVVLALTTISTSSVFSLQANHRLWLAQRQGFKHVALQVLRIVEFQLIIHTLKAKL